MSPCGTIVPIYRGEFSVYYEGDDGNALALYYTFV